MEERIIAEEKTPQETEAIYALPEAIKLPMAWHKFQKNFLLWLIALFYCARAFLTASGNIYYEASILAAVLNGLPLLRILDCAFAAHCAAAAVFCVISAIRAKKGCARLLVKTCLALAIGEAAYMLIRWIIAGLPPVNLQGIALTATHLLLYFINKSYYKKRDLLNRKEAL